MSIKSSILIIATAVLTITAGSGLYKYYKTSTALKHELTRQAYLQEKLADIIEIERYDNTRNIIQYHDLKNSIKHNRPSSDALLFLSIINNTNGLKAVNENYGSVNGAEFIAAFENHLKKFFPEDQGFTISHYQSGSYNVICRSNTSRRILHSKITELKSIWHDTPAVLSDAVKIESPALFVVIGKIPADIAELDETEEKLLSEVRELSKADIFAFKALKE